MLDLNIHLAPGKATRGAAGRGGPAPGAPCRFKSLICMSPPRPLRPRPQRRSPRCTGWPPPPGGLVARRRPLLPPPGRRSPPTPPPRSPPRPTAPARVRGVLGAAAAGRRPRAADMQRWGRVSCALARVRRRQGRRCRGAGGGGRAAPRRAWELGPGLS